MPAAQGRMAGTLRFARATMATFMKLSRTALFDAAKRWDAATVAALLKAAPDLVNATDRQGRTALHIACAVKPAKGLGEPDGIKTVTALLKAGAKLTDDVQTTPNGDRLVMLRDPWGIAVQLVHRATPMLK